MSGIYTNSRDFSLTVIASNPPTGQYNVTLSLHEDHFLDRCEIARLDPIDVNP